MAFADIVSTSSDPRVGAIRMAWWREGLDELDDPKAAPDEPRLKAVAAELLPRGLAGQELSPLEDAWLPLLEPFPWNAAQAEGLRLRGRILFGIGARILGQDGSKIEAVGALWSLVDGAQHCSDPESREALLGEARETLGASGGSIARQLRPLTVLAALAAADLHEGSGLRRLSAAVRHRLFGTLPRS